MINIPPFAIFMLGVLFVPLLKGKVKQGYLILLPLLAFAHLWAISEGIHFSFQFLGYDLVIGRVDKLSMFFGYALVTMALIGIVYGIHVKENGHYFAALTYVGSSLGVVFAGDYFSLFFFWEIMAFSSVCLIWDRRKKASIDAGFRYILIHTFGGLCLLAGIVIHVVNTGSLELGPLQDTGLAYYLILLGVIINAAVPPLHAWLPDAYPEATIAGAIFLSAFTTKTTVYVLMRVFPGAEILVWLGAIMAIYGVVYATLENNIRRLLSYHIISQLGYMVAGIGIGNMMGLNGAAAHAFANILYKGLLFMVAGSVIHMTGKTKLTELGGLYKTMPLTFLLCIIASMSISAFPLFIGFISKSMVVTAAAEEHRGAIWLMLMFASSGTFLSVGLKFPYYIFFGKDSGIRVKEPPFNMLLAMGFAAFLCIFIGIFPERLYRLLPYSLEYAMYTGEHVVWTLQILLFTGLVFFMLLARLKPKDVITLDTDWFYRKGARIFMQLLTEPKLQFGKKLENIFLTSIPKSLSWFCQNPLGACKIALDTALLNRSQNTDLKYIKQEKKRIAREKEIYPGDIIKHWPIGSTVVWITLFLFVYLLIFLAI